MNGIMILLKSLGIKIDPAEIESAWDRTKDAIPRLVAALDENNSRLAAIENHCIAMNVRLLALENLHENGLLQDAANRRSKETELA